MQAKPSDWIAGVHENRLAVASAIAASLLLVLLLAAPSWFRPKPASVASKTIQPRARGLPARPVRNNINGSKAKQMPATRIVEKRSVPKTKKILPVKTITSRHPHPPVTNRHVKAGNSLKYGYYVQVGAFKDPVKAKRMATLLQQTGWHAQIVSKRNNLHAVLSGPLKTRKKAKNMKSRLAKQSGIKGYIIFIAPTRQDPAGPKGNNLPRGGKRSKTS